MLDVYIAASRRTPIGSFGGVFADFPATRLASVAISSLVAGADLDPKRVDEVILGQVLSGGAGQAPARQAMRAAGLPDSTGAVTLNKVCGSGLKAVMMAANAIRAGEAHCVIAGGMESMSNAPHALPRARFGYRMGDGAVQDLMMLDGLTDPETGSAMGVFAEQRAAAHGLSREEQDDYAIASYQRAQVAVHEGLFRDEIVPVEVVGRKGTSVVGEDEEPFHADFEKLRTLRPVFSAGGTITAANASKISDGAAVSLVVSGKALRDLDLVPLARLVAWTTSSHAPAHFPDAPIHVIEKVCRLAHISPGDIDLFEINEAFAAVALIAIKELSLDPARVNPHGGAIALGHPIGASGARILTTLVHSLQRKRGRFGLATLCIGGGEAVAMLVERT